VGQVTAMLAAAAERLRVDGQMDKQTDGQTEKRTNGQTDKRKNDNSKNARMECRLGFQFLFQTISISIIFPFYYFVELIGEYLTS